MATRKKIVVIGGGTGTFTALSGLKKYPFDLAAIVTMADSGSSTGVLRRELGVLPPGDARQCLIALSDADQLTRSMMGYRFSEGIFKGHNLGNLLVAGLQKITGDFEKALAKAGEILEVRGQVLPVTLDNVTLVARVGRQIVRGEARLDEMALDEAQVEDIWLEPRSARANPKALRAIRDADAVVIGPGDVYTSLAPNLLVNGVANAIRTSRAKKICVCNLMTKENHVGDFTVGDFTVAIEKYLGGQVDKVLYNTETPDKPALKRYARLGSKLVIAGRDLDKDRFVGVNLIGKKKVVVHKADFIKRSLIRHDPDKLAKIIARLVRGK